MGTTKQQRTTVTINDDQVEITNLTKPLWPKQNVLKSHYLHYLSVMSQHMLPFLKNRLLTVIRYPHGIGHESFYQKNCPDYAPPFVHTEQDHDINYIVCNNLQTLIWLGNQGAIEFHIPFQTINQQTPSEIVFDLDPPSQAYFSLAVKAAQIMKDLFDRLQLISFIKLSGNKGLQVYIPLQEGEVTYDETRAFTAFIAHYLIEQEPQMFTIERLKKNRHNRLYVDYIQHAEGKTIIAPYSCRGNEDNLVATPLFWEEITDDLHPTTYPMSSIIERVNKKGCPFASFEEAKKEQPIKPVLQWLKQHQL